MPKSTRKKSEQRGKVAASEPAENAAGKAWRSVLDTQEFKKDITTASKFGTDSLQVRGKVFAMN